MSLPEEIRTLLDRSRVGRLATASSDGEPHVVPLCYARVGDRIYFVADDKPKRSGPRALRRLRNLRENPRAALLVDRYAEDWSRLAYALLHLRAREVSDREEWKQAVNALRSRYPQYATMPLRPSRHPVIAMTPVRWHLWTAAQGGRSGRV